MTIPEASQLVLKSGAMAENGELFVLDMGKPIKIIELAENMIRLSGMEPYNDIDIIETGLRPGEKLYEELLVDPKTCTRTANNLIFVAEPETISKETVEGKLKRLAELVESQTADNKKIIEIITTDAAS
jgi:FlaA1/EpsC-like NDP-sugar epimerase